MAARQGAPVLGVLCERPRDGKAPRKERWDVTFGYRYMNSFRHYVGTVEQKQREQLGNQIRNYFHLFDFSVGYQVNPRWTLTASMPLVKIKREQLYVPTGEVNVVSQGDALFGFRRWMFRPPTESRRNLGLGVSMKVPTGRFRQTFAARDRAGNPIVATADQSVQPGDGGTGFSIDLSAYTPAPLGTWAYFQSTYLFNPRNTNGVATFRTRRGEEVMSVSDQYLYRGGVTRLVPGIRRLAFSIGGRMEGVPVRDLLGRSDGFRRPGYVISLDPGVMWNVNGYTISANAPWALERNRRKSVSDYRNGVHGDAAFADYTIIVGVSRRF